MIQYKQPRKIKSFRKKKRDDLLETLKSKYPTWFDNRDKKEIFDILAKFKNSGLDIEDFPDFMLCYELNQK